MSSWNTKLSIQSLQNQINKISLAGPIQNPLLADINANNKNISGAGTISAETLITKSLDINNDLSCETLTANTINCSNFVPPISNGVDGRSAFGINLLGGATYVSGDLSSIKTNGTSGYGITTSSFLGGSFISGYSTRTNAVYIGLTQTTNVINPSAPAASFSHLLYSEETNIFRLDNGVVGPSAPYPNANPNYTFSVVYDNTNIMFFCDGVELVALRLNVGANKSYYGAWCSYLDKTISSIQWSAVVEGPQGIQGIQGIKGDKGDPGNLANPVIFTDTFKLNDSVLGTMANFDGTNKEIQFTGYSPTVGVENSTLTQTYNSLTFHMYGVEMLKANYDGVSVYDGITVNGTNGASVVYNPLYYPVKKVAKSLINVNPSALFIGIGKYSILNFDITSIMDNSTCVDLTFNTLSFTWSNQNITTTLKSFTGYLFLTNQENAGFNPISGSCYSIQFIYSMTNKTFSSNYQPINLKFYSQGAGSNTNTIYLNMTFGADSSTVQLQLSQITADLNIEASEPNTPISINPTIL